MKQFLLIFLLMGGCGPGGLFLPNIKDYTPEQLEAYKDLGYDAIRCATVKGPPPSGTVTTVTVPKNRKVWVRMFGCDVHSIAVGEATEGEVEPSTPTIP